VRTSGEPVEVLPDAALLAVLVVLSVLAFFAAVCRVPVVNPVESESSKSEAEVRFDMDTVASFRNYLWTDQDKILIGTVTKTVQATFGFSCATLGVACIDRKPDTTVTLAHY
jgi:hypothetical protein